MTAGVELELITDAAGLMQQRQKQRKWRMTAAAAVQSSLLISWASGPVCSV